MERTIATLLSIPIAGLGQIIRGKNKAKRGIIILLTIYFALPITLYMLLLAEKIIFFFSLLGMAFIFVPVLWGISILDSLAG
ncbi:hypothetical protein ACFL52_02745 [Candidatus Margulisiibacteriota bacterium]